jgi:hypothetical protein
MIAGEKGYQHLSAISWGLSSKRDAINKLASKLIATAIYAAARFAHAQIFMTLRLVIRRRPHDHHAVAV